jgi:transposase
MTIINRARLDHQTPVKCCPSCYAYMHSAVKLCYACGEEFPRRVDPLKAWEHHGQNRRAIEICGILHVAFRRNASSGWTIREGHTLRDIATGLRTRAVTAFFRRWDDKAEAEAIKALRAEFG